MQAKGQTKGCCRPRGRGVVAALANAAALGRGSAQTPDTRIQHGTGVPIEVHLSRVITVLEAAAGPERAHVPRMYARSAHHRGNRGGKVLGLTRLGIAVEVSSK